MKITVDMLEEILSAAEDADHAMDRDTEEQLRKVFDYDPPDDAEIVISAKTHRLVNVLFGCIEKCRPFIKGARTFELSKEWCRESAQIEGDAEIGAGLATRDAEA